VNIDILVSDSESHVFELIDGSGIHDIEIVFPWREILRDFHPGNLLVYDLEFRVFEDQIIAELDGDDLVETIPLDDYEPVFVVSHQTGSDIGDIDGGIRVFEREPVFGSQDLPVFKGKEYEVFAARKGVTIYPDEQCSGRIYRSDTLFSDIYKLDGVEIVSPDGDKIIDVGIVVRGTHTNVGRIGSGDLHGILLRRFPFLYIFLWCGRDFRWYDRIGIARVFRFSDDFQERSIFHTDILEILFLYPGIIEFYTFDIEKVPKRGDIDRNISRRVSGKYPGILDLVPLLIGHIGTEIRLPREVPYKRSHLETGTEIEIADLVEEEKKSSKQEDRNKEDDSGAFVHRS